MSLLEERTTMPARESESEGVWRQIAGAGIVIAASGIVLSGCGSGNDGVSQNAALRDVARELGADELAHVRFLRNAITNAGGQPVAKPALKLDALGPVTNSTQFLTVARAFEDVGVSAYGGAARFITSKDILEAAARILAAEAYHAGNLRYQIVERGLTVGAVDAKDQPPNSNNFYATDANALAVIRTPQEVLAAVSGFFPNGINGTTTPANDIDILNLALNLEYLEAEFYSFVNSSAGIPNADTTGTGTPGQTTGAPTFRL